MNKREETRSYDFGEICEHDKLKRQCDNCWHAWELQQKDKIIAILRAEVLAARQLGDASPVAIEYCREQWLQARKATDAAKGLE